MGTVLLTTSCHGDGPEGIFSVRRRQCAINTEHGILSTDSGAADMNPGWIHGAINRLSPSLTLKDDCCRL